MKKHLKPFAALLFAICLLMGQAAGIALAADCESTADAAAAWLLRNVPVDAADTELDNAADWTALALARGGYAGYEAYPAYLDGAVQANFDQMYLSDYARAALAADAAGGDARSVGGHDLIDAIVKTDIAQEVYTDGISYALLALDAKQYQAPDEIRQAMVGALCAAQREDGGFNYLLSVNADDPYSLDGSVDTTGPVLAALAPYQADEKVAAVIDRALAFLKASQNPETAGFGFMGSDSAETISMAVIGLSALGINPCGPDFTKNGQTMLDALLTFVNADGGMRSYDGSSNILTTYQSLCALEAYARFAEQRAAFYDFSDVRQQPPEDTTPESTATTAAPAVTAPEGTEHSETAGAPESTTAPAAENPATGSSAAAVGAAVLALLAVGALAVSRKRGLYA